MATPGADNHHKRQQKTAKDHKIQQKDRIRWKNTYYRHQKQHQRIIIALQIIIIATKVYKTLSTHITLKIGMGNYNVYVTSSGVNQAEGLVQTKFHV